MDAVLFFAGGMLVGAGIMYWMLARDEQPPAQNEIIIPTPEQERVLEPDYWQHRGWEDWQVAHIFDPASVDILYRPRYIAGHELADRNGCENPFHWHATDNARLDSPEMPGPGYDVQTRRPT